MNLFLETLWLSASPYSVREAQRCCSSSSGPLHGSTAISDSLPINQTPAKTVDNSAQDQCLTSIGINFVIKVEGLMTSAEREPIMEVWGRSPQQDPGAEPWSGGQGVKLPWSILSFRSANGAQMCQLYAFWKNIVALLLAYRHQTPPTV